MAKLSNLIMMINLLKNGRKYSIKELSEKLEVSERTIREYKLFLEEAGIYIETLRGPYGGYVLKRDVNLPKIDFNQNDIELLKIVIPNIKDVNLIEKVHNLSNKINNCIIEENNRNVKLIADENELKVYNTISKALKHNYKLKIKYYNIQHGNSIRTIYPLALYLFQNEWWCSSYWEEKDDMRQFHLKRILNAEIIEETFDPQKLNIKF